MQLKEPVQTVEPASTGPATKDRRRPRRNDQVSAHLIPLLRNPAADTLTLPADNVDPPPPNDDLRPARGIIVGSLLSLPLWAGIAAAVRAVLR